MGGVVELRCNGISLEKSKCLGQTFCSKLKRTSRWFESLKIAQSRQRSVEEVSACARRVVASGRSGGPGGLDLHREANTDS
jgi:hypothetical protein